MTEIAQGGMGTVLLAVQTSLGRAAVLKKARRDVIERAELEKRFEREAKTAATIHHQNVVAVYDYFAHRDDRYIAQEFVDGTDLDSVLRIKGALPWSVALLIALEALRGLEEIHAVGTVQRDLKPSNILLGRRGEVKIADFGIAIDATGSNLTAPGILIGTPPYMAPEQLRGERADGRSDIFAWGVVLHQVLTGELPFPEPAEGDSDTLLQRMERGRHRSVRRTARDVPHWVSRLVRRCLRAKPRRRTATVRELRHAIERRLGNPSPADCRAAIACWMWDAQIFQPRKHETVVRVTPSLPRSPASLIRTAILLGAGLVFSAFLLIWFLPPRHLRYVPAAIVQPVKRIPVPDASGLPAIGGREERDASATGDAAKPAPSAPLPLRAIPAEEVTFP
ncbi:MAG TPA: serine/threonine-protein kinase [bacterium]|nr:serine/threonine-protein kinase [bacterium]